GRLRYAGIDLESGGIESRSIANGLGVWIVGLEREGEARTQGSIAAGLGARERRELNLIAYHPGQAARVSAEQAPGSDHNRIKHGLDVRLRATNHAQNVTGGGLCIERRGQLTITGLQFREQPHVLDGDNSLVGEGLEKCKFIA